MVSSEQLENTTVLYVEDEDVARMAVGAFLKRQVSQLVTASNGEEGLRQYKEHRPAVVVTDLEMPVMNGMEMIRRIRSVDSDVPIIITTAYDDEAHACPEADRVIIKPIMFNDLLETIIDCLGEKQ